MKITFQGHSPTERQVELTQEELFQLFEAMKESLLDDVEYGQFVGYSLYNEKTMKIMKLCETHNVDVAYTKDRLAFFTEITKNLPNPYQ
jgi:hypothetical protein